MTPLLHKSFSNAYIIVENYQKPFIFETCVAILGSSYIPEVPTLGFMPWSVARVQNLGYICYV